MLGTLKDSLEEGNLTTAIFVDFSKAFDWLRNDPVIRKIENRGIVGTTKT